MPDDDEPVVCQEQQNVVQWRLHQARKAGLTLVEARLFAESDADLGVLRQLVDNGCPARTIAKIVI